MKARKSWREKLADSKDLPKVVKIAKNMSARWGTGTAVVPAPREVDEIMGQVPRGKLVTIDVIRTLLAKKHKTAMACPLTTGIFAWIAANAAAEAASEGQKRTTPYWPTLKSGGQLNEKYPGGIALLTERLEAQGHTVVQKGKRYYVARFEESLI